MTITGTCFGTGGAFTNGNSDHFRVTDLGPKGTVTGSRTRGRFLRRGGTPAPAPPMPSTAIHLTSSPAASPRGRAPRSRSGRSGPAYGEYREGVRDEELNWVVDAGDKMVVQVWNANLPTSADWCLVTVAAGGAPGSGTTCSAVLVAGNPVTAGGGGGAASTGTDHSRARQHAPAVPSRRRVSASTRSSSTSLTRLKLPSMKRTAPKPTPWAPAPFRPGGPLTTPMGLRARPRPRAPAPNGRRPGPAPTTPTTAEPGPHRWRSTGARTMAVAAAAVGAAGPAPEAGAVPSSWAVEVVLLLPAPTLRARQQAPAVPSGRRSVRVPGVRRPVLPGSNFRLRGELHPGRRCRYRGVQSQRRRLLGGWVFVHGPGRGRRLRMGLSLDRHLLRLRLQSGCHASGVELGPALLVVKCELRAP